jgi:putative colanic acid biosynthesis acetyltransferase WcaF
MSATVDLSNLNSAAQSEYDIGRSYGYRLAWYLLGAPLLRCAILPSSAFRVRLLRWFGAEIGEGAVIKPGVRVKFPWKLKTGSHCWIGEDCWIDNLAMVTLGDNVCLSQDVYLCTGSHDWTDPSFSLITRSIRIHDGAWVAARVSVGPGAAIGEHGIAGFGAVVTGYIPPYEIHSGNPAVFVRKRRIAAPRMNPGGNSF